jgi:hypothetical protein
MELDPRDCLNWSTKQNEWTGYLSHFHVNDHDLQLNMIHEYPRSAIVMKSKNTLSIIINVNVKTECTLVPFSS